MGLAESTASCHFECTSFFLLMIQKLIEKTKKNTNFFRLFFFCPNLLSFPGECGELGPAVKPRLRVGCAVGVSEAPVQFAIASGTSGDGRGRWVVGSGERVKQQKHRLGFRGWERGWLGSCWESLQNWWILESSQDLGRFKDQQGGEGATLRGAYAEPFPWKLLSVRVACFSQSRNSQNLQIETEGLESCSFLYGRMIVFAASSASAVWYSGCPPWRPACHSRHEWATNSSKHEPRLLTCDKTKESSSKSLIGLRFSRFQAISEVLGKTGQTTNHLIWLGGMSLAMRGAKRFLAFLVNISRNGCNVDLTFTGK